MTRNLPAEALSLRQAHPDWGYIRIARKLEWDKDKVRRVVEHAERRSSLPARPSGLMRYDAARRAVAEAKSFDEVRDWEDKAAAVREYSRRAGDRTMELDAIEIQARARRRRGELLGQLKSMGILTEGRREKTVIEGGQLSGRLTLEDLSISRNESSRDQKVAAIDGNSFERLIECCRSYMEQHPEKHAMDVLKERDGPVNGARSIMGSRAEPNDSLDFFPTPPWATRALFECVLPELDFLDFKGLTAWEPACGEGHMAEVLKEYFGHVAATDIFDYGYAAGACDFLAPDLVAGARNPSSGSLRPYDWIVTNPPFGDKAIQFVLRALDFAAVGVAMFFRSQWAVEGIERYQQIFRDRPPTLCAFFVERVNLCKGHWDPDGTTATAYCWLIWVKDSDPMPPFWIPPGCRTVLTKPDDRERFAEKK